MCGLNSLSIFRINYCAVLSGPFRKGLTCVKDYFTTCLGVIAKCKDVPGLKILVEGSPSFLQALQQLPYHRGNNEGIPHNLYISSQCCHLNDFIARKELVNLCISHARFTPCCLFPRLHHFIMSTSGLLYSGMLYHSLQYLSVATVYGTRRSEKDFTVTCAVRNHRTKQKSPLWLR